MDKDAIRQEILTVSREWHAQEAESDSFHLLGTTSYNYNIPPGLVDAFTEYIVNHYIEKEES